MANHDEQQPIRCSFCGKREGQVQMIAGPDVFICGECVQACSELLLDLEEQNNGIPSLESLPTPKIGRAHV